MERKTYYALMVTTAIVLLLLGIGIVMVDPTNLQAVTGGMFLVAVAVLVLLALVHFPPPPHVRRAEIEARRRRMAETKDLKNLKTL
jgi:uncharacterized membrane protein